MRVTNKVMTDTVAGNLFKNVEQLLKTQNVLSSGKRISKPSDDPIGMSKVLDYRKTICTIDQYDRNISHGESWLNVTDSTLDAVGDLLIRAKELALSQANATANADTRGFVAEEVKSIYDHLLQLANTKLGKSYIFAGHKTDATPFSRDEDYSAEYKGDDGDIRIIVGENVDITINANGKKVFGTDSADGVDIFNVLKDLKVSLETNDSAAISDQLGPLDDALDQILKVRARVGTKLNRLEATENHWADFKLNITQMLSDTEDADILKTVTDLASQETAYQASLAASARVIQPSLIDFLR